MPHNHAPERLLKLMQTGDGIIAIHGSRKYLDEIKACCEAKGIPAQVVEVQAFGGSGGGGASLWIPVVANALLIVANWVRTNRARCRIKMKNGANFIEAEAKSPEDIKELLASAKEVLISKPRQKRLADGSKSPPTP